MKTNLQSGKQIEFEFSSSSEYRNPYTDVDVYVRFKHEDGTQMVRPAFWDGGHIWRVRFTSPQSSGIWQWQSFSAPRDPALDGLTGEFSAAPDDSSNRFYRHGFWHIPSGQRNLRHADGTPALIIADTAWALPWRATLEQCEIYARDRQSKGFNAALLMSIQPDRNAHGPRSRTEHDGFEVGFEDLPAGHINQINPAYFQTLDQLALILVGHEIVPVWQPVFHGYGWKGLDTAGNVISPVEYARYCRYLIARYGAMPAVWLVAADGDGLAPGVDAAGWEIERWDAYHHPTGIHYAPHHNPWAYQDRAWLDFQWCQTGHNGEHVPQRVATMWEKRPIKAVANGEPTYENIGQAGRAAGWWQGHEAWTNLTAGSTMGIIYGAGSLWQWRLDAAEEHQVWCIAPGAGWRDALDFEGSRYPGIVSRIFEGLPFAEMQPDFRHTFGRSGLIVPDKLFAIYLPDGGDLALAQTEGVPDHYWIFDPRSGEMLASGQGHGPIPMKLGDPRVVVFANPGYRRT